MSRAPAGWPACWQFLENKCEILWMSRLGMAPQPFRHILPHTASLEGVRTHPPAIDLRICGVAAPSGRVCMQPRRARVHNQPKVPSEAWS